MQEHVGEWPFRVVLLYWITYTDAFMCKKHFLLDSNRRAMTRNAMRERCGRTFNMKRGMGML